MNRKKREKGDEIENIEKELKELKEERKRIIVNSKEENVRRLKTIKNKIEKKRKK